VSDRKVDRSDRATADAEDRRRDTSNPQDQLLIVDRIPAYTNPVELGKQPPSVDDRVVCVVNVRPLSRSSTSSSGRNASIARPSDDA